MKNWKQCMLAVIAATAVMAGGGQGAYANQADVHKHHELEKKKIEEQQLMKQAGVDKQELEATKAQIRTVRKEVEASKQELKMLIEKQADQEKQKELRERIKQDLAANKETFAKLHELRAANRALREELKAAFEAKDTVKIKKLFDKVQANHHAMLPLMQQVSTALQAEVAKLKG